jgi:large subunit ribosomal protein L23
MADITDIKAILYTEKTIELQENGVIVVQTSPRMTKNGLKEVFK